MGAGYSSAVIPIDTGVEIPDGKHAHRDELSSDECIKMFGAKDAVLMNFIPQMLTALALEQAEAYINYCRDNRLSEYKRHNREMRGCIDEYNHGLRASYGQAWDAYLYSTRCRPTCSSVGARSPTRLHGNMSGLPTPRYLHG